jgi:acyl carrier protein
MNKINNKLIEFIFILLEDKNQTITLETSLIGDSSLLDSMKLVELCLLLEDHASDLGFEFDWTSDVAMSKSKSMFRTVRSLANEFTHQMEEKN